MTIPVQIIKPSGQDDVAPHEHDATEISGVFNFLRALKVIIQGDIKSDNWDGLSQVPGSGATVGFFLDGSSGNAEFVDLFANAAGVDELTLNAQDGVNEGGQLAYQGAGSHSTALVNDRFQDTWRVIIGGNAPLQVSDSATILLAGGSETVRVTADGINRAEEPAYLFKETVYFTANGSFAKADYPGLRAVRVRVQGGGGAGGGAAATASNGSFGAGGAGGGYAEKIILEASLGASETVTVGAAGTGNSGASGGSGGNSSFGAHAAGNGGAGGATSGASTTEASTSSLAAGGTATGDLAVRGGAGSAGLRLGSSFVGFGGAGGAAVLGPGAGSIGNGVGGQGLGPGGRDYGGGGGGSINGSSQSAAVGGDGGAGIVIVDVYV